MRWAVENTMEPVSSFGGMVASLTYNLTQQMPMSEQSDLLFLSWWGDPVQGGGKEAEVLIPILPSAGMGNRVLLLCENVKRQKNSSPFPTVINFSKSQFYFSREIITGKTKYLSRNIELCLCREL